MQKMFKWSEEKRQFSEEYARQWNKLAGEGDQVLLESEYGYMLAITFDICKCCAL